jgi:hypothetical protein
MQFYLRRLLWSAFLFLALPAIVFSVQAQPGPLTGFGFLRLEPSARAAALGGAFTAVNDGEVNGLFYNPALLGEEEHGAVSLSYMNYLSDVNAGFLAYARDFRGMGTIGAGIRFLNWGDVQGADEQGNPTEEFSASDVALTIGFSRPYARMTYGVNAHLIHSSIESYGATAIAADLGLAYDIPEQHMTLGISLNHVGVALSSLGSVEDELPLDLRIGVTKRLQYVPLLVTITGYNLHDIGNEPEGMKLTNQIMHHITAGGEFQISDAFRLRFGYNHRRHEMLKTKSRLDLAGFGAGFGIRVKRVRVDYAYNTWSSVGSLHHFTVGTKL